MKQFSHSSFPLQLLCCALISVACYLLLAPAALAMAGQGNFNVSFFTCVGGRGTGSLFGIFNQCPTQLTVHNVFSFLTCNIERLITDLFGDVYCGIIRKLEPTIRAVLTLSVVLFGVGFTVGWIPATGRDFLIYLLKLAFVYAFATQADLMIGTAYRFFVTGSQEGIAIVVTTLFDKQTGITGLASNFVGGANIFATIDRVLAEFFTTVTASVGADPAEGDAACKNAIFAAMAVMLIAFPPMAFMFMLVLAKILMTFFRAIFGYLFSLVGLAFLMVLSPIFLSFALFKQTRQLFDKWLGHLVSYSLQMVVVFAFMAFVFSMNVSNIANDLAGVVRYNQESYSNRSNTLRMPWAGCTLCDFEVVKLDPVSRAELQVYGENERIDPANSKLRCKTNDVRAENYLSPLMMIAPDNTCNEGRNCNGQPDAVGLKETQRIQNTLLTFMMSGFLSLLVLAYIVDQMLTYAPMVAQTLSSGMSGSNYAVQIGGGYNPSGRPATELPFEQQINTFGGAFSEAYNAQSRSNQNTFQRLGAGVRDGAWAFFFGRDDGGRSQGLIDGTVSWLLNPTRGAEDDDRNAFGGSGATSAAANIRAAVTAMRGSAADRANARLYLNAAKGETDDPVLLGEIEDLLAELGPEEPATVDRAEVGSTPATPPDTPSGGGGTSGTGGPP